MKPRSDLEWNAQLVMYYLDKPIDRNTLHSFLHTRYGYNDRDLLNSALTCLMHDGYVKDNGSSLSRKYSLTDKAREEISMWLNSY